MAPDPYKYFRVEARELADQLGQGVLELERGGSDAEIVGRLLRLAHTLKGAARVVRQPEIADHAHAIEDVLTPFREQSGALPRERIDGILKLVDGIAQRVAALQTATAAAPAPVERAPVPEDGFRSVRTDMREVDELIDGLSEAYAQVASLAQVTNLIEGAARLADLIGERLAGQAGRGVEPGTAARSDRAFVAAEDLKGILARIRRMTSATHERVDRELRQVRDSAEQLRLVPAGTLFGSLERAARDAARALGKQIVFRASGGEVRLDAHVARTVQEALLQITRNAVAHGIELPLERKSANKPEQGAIGIDVLRHGRRVVFRCSDDGRGVDFEGVRRAASRKGLPAAELHGLDVEGLIRLMLRGGLSTAATVTEVAGRGIGMDIVRDALVTLGGDVNVQSTPGGGTVFELTMLVSVSSLEALAVQAGGKTVTIPLDAVRHTVRLEARDIYRTSLGDAIVHDGQATPFIALARLLGDDHPGRSPNGASAIVVSGTEGTVAIGVERVLGTSSIVWRALPELAPGDAIIGGASLDAGGIPMLMLDPDGLVAAALNGKAQAPELAVQQRPILVVDDSLTTRMLEQSILELAGYRVDLANSAEEALEQAHRADYALILVDVEMPGMDGFAFIETIRRDPDLGKTPAILVTSRNAPEDRKRGEEVGANGYVVKSEFDQAQLLHRIRELVA